MADRVEIVWLFEAASPAAVELNAFADAFVRLSCRQREVLLDLIRQIIRHESDGENVEVARLLRDAPALLRLSARTN